MHLDTGQIESFNSKDELREALKRDPNIREVTAELTDKQKKDGQISLKDHKSPAGKQLTEERRKAGLTKNQYRKLKRKGVLR